MNNKIINVVLFTAGAAIGSIVTWTIVKKKYEQIAQEEIDSVKEEYSRLYKLNREETIEEFEDEAEEEPQSNNTKKAEVKNDRWVEKTLFDYAQIADKYRGSSDNTEDENPNEEGGNGEYEDGILYSNAPYVISPDDFASSPPGYNAQPLDYFADGILADGWGVEVDIDDTIGEDALDHFGEYADDIVYVRNEANEIDYEVTRDPRTYEEARLTNPNPYYNQ